MRPVLLLLTVFLFAVIVAFADGDSLSVRSRRVQSKRLFDEDELLLSADLNRKADNNKHIHPGIMETYNKNSAERKEELRDEQRMRTLKIDLEDEEEKRKINQRRKENELAEKRVHTSALEGISRNIDSLNDQIKREQEKKANYVSPLSSSPGERKENMPGDSTLGIYAGEDDISKSGIDSGKSKADNEAARREFDDAESNRARTRVEGESAKAEQIESEMIKSGEDRTGKSLEEEEAELAEAKEKELSAKHRADEESRKILQDRIAAKQALAVEKEALGKSSISETVAEKAISEAETDSASAENKEISAQRIAETMKKERAIEAEKLALAKEDTSRASAERQREHALERKAEIERVTAMDIERRINDEDREEKAANEMKTIEKQEEESSATQASADEEAAKAERDVEKERIEASIADRKQAHLEHRKFRHANQEANLELSRVSEEYDWEETYKLRKDSFEEGNEKIQGTFDGAENAAIALEKATDEVKVQEENASQPRKAALLAMWQSMYKTDKKARKDAMVIKKGQGEVQAYAAFFDMKMKRAKQRADKHLANAREFLAKKEAAWNLWRKHTVDARDKAMEATRNSNVAQEKEESAARHRLLEKQFAKAKKADEKRARKIAKEKAADIKLREKSEVEQQKAEEAANAAKRSRKTASISAQTAIKDSVKASRIASDDSRRRASLIAAARTLAASSRMAAATAKKAISQSKSFTATKTASRKRRAEKEEDGGGDGKDCPPGKGEAYLAMERAAKEEAALAKDEAEYDRERGLVKTLSAAIATGRSTLSEMQGKEMELNDAARHDEKNARADEGAKKKLLETAQKHMRQATNLQASSQKEMGHGLIKRAMALVRRIQKGDESDNNNNNKNNNNKNNKNSSKKKNEEDPMHEEKSRHADAAQEKMAEVEILKTKRVEAENKIAGDNVKLKNTDEVAEKHRTNVERIKQKIEEEQRKRTKK